MSAAAISIQVDHSPSVHHIEPVQDNEPISVTLLELVKAISEVTEDEKEVVATVMHMLRNGRVRLSGNFHDEPIERLEA
jgi:hypothetical protein